MNVSEKAYVSCQTARHNAILKLEILIWLFFLPKTSSDTMGGTYCMLIYVNLMLRSSFCHLKISNI